MRHLQLLPVLLFLISACGQPTPPVNQGKEAASQNDTSQTTTALETTSNTQDLPIQKLNCDWKGEVLNGNEVWLPKERLLFAIVADSTTYDEDYGESHRVLKVLDATDNCALLEQEVLPVNVSPDFPYYIAHINYNNISQLIAIRGVERIYCYDIENKQLLPAMTPVFKSERSGEDAQSGRIRKLELWENFLIGYSSDYGCFAFDLDDKKSPTPIMPFAEYKISETDFASLFMLPSEGDKVQALMPYYARKEGLKINPLFKEPRMLNLQVTKSALNNPQIIVRDANTRDAVAIDMKNRKTIDLPSEIAGKKTKEVLEWLKEQNK